tara:strand:- start:5 stop:376 length:372 start_codon:yes stop_codon:yes gene_type:complete
LEFITIFKKKNMKKLIIICLLIAPLSLSAQSEKNVKSNFEVNGNCEMCKKRIEKAALSVKGVKMVIWDIPSNIITVTHNTSKAPLRNIQKAIADVGHDTPLVKASDEVYNELPMCCLYERKIE